MQERQLQLPKLGKDAYYIARIRESQEELARGVQRKQAEQMMPYSVEPLMTKTGAHVLLLKDRPARTTQATPERRKPQFKGPYQSSKALKQQLYESYRIASHRDRQEPLLEMPSHMIREQYQLQPIEESPEPSGYGEQQSQGDRSSQWGGQSHYVESFQALPPQEASIGNLNGIRFYLNEIQHLKQMKPQFGHKTARVTNPSISHIDEEAETRPWRPAHTFHAT